MATVPIAGKVVALTGGARGIGLETVKALVARGAKVGVGDLDLDLLQTELGKLSGETAAFPLDVSQRDSFAAFLDGVEQQLGPIDVLVNNAGIMYLGDFLDENDEVAARMIDVNFKGTMIGLKLAIPRLRDRRGHIVNLVSGTARYPLAGAATYSATKFAVYGLLEAVASELKAKNVDVALTAVLPAVVKTDLTTGMKSATRGVPTLVPEEVAAAVIESIEKRPREMYVPKSLRATFYLGTLMPRKLGELVARATNADRVMLDIDHASRAGYEERSLG